MELDWTDLDGAWLVEHVSYAVLYQQLVLGDGEDMNAVAHELVGPKGKANLLGVSYLTPGDQWPTAVYRGSRRELLSLHAKANGSKIGRPRNG